MSTPRLFVLVAVFAGVLMLPAGAMAIDRYVDEQTGEDTGTCAFEAAPCVSIQGALAVSDPGDIIYIDDGQYATAGLTLTGGRSLVYLNFVLSDTSVALLDGGAERAVTVTDPGSEITGLTIRGNGGGVLLNALTIVLNNVFDDPDAESGTAVVISAAGSGSLVDGNDLSDPNPGPTRARTGITADITSATISNNTLDGFNNGINATTPYSEAATLLIENNEVTGTHHEPGHGQAIVVAGNFSNVKVSHNRVTDGGAGDQVFALAAYRNADFDHNFVSGHDYGIRVIGDGTNLSFTGDRITDNTFGIYAIDNNTANELPTSFSLTNVTSWGNSVDVQLWSAHMDMDSTIVGTVVGAHGSATCNITYSRGPAIGDNPSGCDNFSTDLDPNFVNAAAGDFHIHGGSWMVDAGNPAAPPEGAVDFDGDPRAWDAQPRCVPVHRRDIGADEYIPTVELDCIAPETTLTKKPKKKVKSKKVTFKLAADEFGSSFECKIDKKPWKPCSATVKFNVKPGKHTFQARATDASGNTDISAVTYKFKRVKPKKKRS